MDAKNDKVASKTVKVGKKVMCKFRSKKQMNRAGRQHRIPYELMVSVTSDSKEISELKFCNWNLKSSISLDFVCHGAQQVQHHHQLISPEYHSNFDGLEVHMQEKCECGRLGIVRIVSGLTGKVLINADKPTRIGLIEVSGFELVTDTVMVYGFDLFVTDKDKQDSKMFHLAAPGEKTNVKFTNGRAYDIRVMMGFEQVN